MTHPGPEQLLERGWSTGHSLKGDKTQGQKHKQAKTRGSWVSLLSVYVDFVPSAVQIFPLMVTYRGRWVGIDNDKCMDG